MAYHLVEDRSDRSLHRGAFRKAAPGQHPVAAGRAATEGSPGRLIRIPVGGMMGACRHEQRVVRRMQRVILLGRRMRVLHRTAEIVVFGHLTGELIQKATAIGQPRKLNGASFDAAE